MPPIDSLTETKTFAAARPAGEPLRKADGRPAPPRLLITFPAYNEEAGVGELIESISTTLDAAGLDYRIIVVDDGSTDGTARVVSDASFHWPVDLVSHEANQGYGAALRTCLTNAAGAARPDDVIVTMDADNTHQPALMLRMLQMIGEGHDVVTGSRFCPGAQTVGVPPLRVLMGYASRTFFKLALPIRGIREYTCGYRAFKASVLQEAIADFGEAFVSEPGFAATADVLLKLRGRNLVMGEAPLILRYDLKQGDSKMNVRKTAIQTLRLIARRKLRGPRA